MVWSVAHFERIEATLQVFALPRVLIRKPVSTFRNAL